ncbi:MAG: (2Fe-2S) ferredoxin domain-containing protein [Rickettsiales bacterium]|nr:(2Fe-2S) ferredoxin domain-containing protein [Rickettsiales bacterium]
MSAPFFDHHIFCCTNRREDTNSRGCCATKGAEELRDYMKSRVKKLGLPKTRVNNSGCLDRCEHGPCMVIYPEGIWYRCQTKEDIDEVIAEHLVSGRVVKRLMIDN